MESPRALCPTCQQEVVFVPAGEGKACPKCGTTFHVGNGAQLPSAPASPRKTATTWLVLLASLLTPPLLTFLVALSGSEQLSTGVALGGSGVAAVFGAIWLASRLNLQLGLRIGIGIVLAPVFFGACFALSFAGCALGTPGGFKVGG